MKSVKVEKLLALNYFTGEVMENLKLTIELLPKGVWNNDFSKTLPKKEWDILRDKCYKRANGVCQICGYKTDGLDAHEVWEFDTKNKTQKVENLNWKEIYVKYIYLTS